VRGIERARRRAILRPLMLMGGVRMGMIWTARLRVDFEMEDGAPENLAQNRLRTAISQFEHFIETGAGIGKTLVKQGSAKVEIVAQGPTA
jgi:hypothetical protein